MAVLNVDTDELEPVHAPDSVGDTRPLRAIVGATADHVLVTTADADYLWNRGTADTTLVGHGGRILGAAPARRPVAVLVGTNETLKLVDLTSGTVHDLPGRTDPGVVPRLFTDAAGQVAVVAGPGGGATAIDLSDGTIEHHDPEVLFYHVGLSMDGSTIIGGRRTDHGFAIEAIPLFDPTPSMVWYTPKRPETQVAVAWVGGRVLAVDYSGRVMTITEGVISELGRLQDPEVAEAPAIISSVIHTDPIAQSSPGALIEQQGSGASRWFRVNVATGTIEELPDMEGHSFVPSTLAGHLLVGMGDVGDGFSSLRLIRLADGSTVELTDDSALTPLNVLSVSDSVVGLLRLDGDLAETELIDTSGKRRGVVSGRLGFVADSGVSHVAVFFPNTDIGGEGPLTRIITLDGSANDVSFPGLYPLAWLPSG